MRDPILVLKFGSSVLRSEEDLPRAVHEIYRWYRQGYRVVAVVSAFAGVTDDRFARARECCPDSDAAATAALVATGEAYSAALLGLSLDRSGVPVSVLDAAAIRLETVGPKLNANPVSVDVDSLLRSLEHRPVAIVPGFVGRDEDGGMSLLGRGGSDLTAVFLAQKLGARCRLIKDVDGLYQYDPAANAPAPRRYRQIDYKDALELGGEVVQPKAICFIREYGQTIEVSSLNSELATLVCAAKSAFSPREISKPPLRIGLLGLGTVGMGVFQKLLREPDLFDVSAAAILDRCKPRELPIPSHVRITDAWSVIESDCDVVIELIGGLSPAAELVRFALQHGKNVITANKLLLSIAGEELRKVADRNGVELLYSAAVGGGAPMLETVRRIAKDSEIVEICGVLNGTCNFVLDSIASGQTREDAVRLAQVNGFAEADPIQDLDGSDAAQKLALLAHAAFDALVPFGEIEKEGILGIPASEVRRFADAGQKVRLIARATRSRSGICCSVSPAMVDVGHPFASVMGEQNCLIVTTATREVFTVRGRGAGRWPAAESVFADALDLWRGRRVVRDVSEEEQLVGGAA